MFVGKSTLCRCNDSTNWKCLPNTHTIITVHFWSNLLVFSVRFWFRSFLRPANERQKTGESKNEMQTKGRNVCLRMRANELQIRFSGGIPCMRWTGRLIKPERAQTHTPCPGPSRKQTPNSLHRAESASELRQKAWNTFYLTLSTGQYVLRCFECGDGGWRTMCFSLHDFRVALPERSEMQMVIWYGGDDDDNGDDDA